MINNPIESRAMISRMVNGVYTSFLIFEEPYHGYDIYKVVPHSTAKYRQMESFRTGYCDKYTNEQLKTILAAWLDKHLIEE